MAAHARPRRAAWRSSACWPSSRSRWRSTRAWTCWWCSSLIVLALLGFGVLGALTSRRPMSRRRCADRRPLGRPPAPAARSAVATLALLLAPLAAVAAAYLALVARRGRAAARRPAARRGHAAGRGARASRAEPEPLADGEPVPGIPLAAWTPSTCGCASRRAPGSCSTSAAARCSGAGDPLRVLPMASLTKIMTALLVVERTRPGRRRCGSPARRSLHGLGRRAAARRAGACALETLLNGLLLVSGNDAAIALAVHVSGSERRFVGLMNRRARRLGPRAAPASRRRTGSRPGNRSCARDLAVLTRLAMSKPRIRRIARRRQAAFRFPIKGGKLYLNGHNPLMRLGYPGAIGPQDRLHRRGRPLLRGRGPARRPPARRGAARLARSRQARAEAAGRGLRAELRREVCDL